MGRGAPVRWGPAPRRGPRSRVEGLHGFVRVEAAAGAISARGRGARELPRRAPTQVRVARQPTAPRRFGSVEFTRRASTPGAFARRIHLVVQPGPSAQWGAFPPRPPRSRGVYV